MNDFNGYEEEPRVLGGDPATPAYSRENGELSSAISQLSIGSGESLITNKSIHLLNSKSRDSSSSNESFNFDILPSYQMHQSILNRPLSSDDATVPSLLPSYSMTPSADVSSLETSAHSEFVDLHEGSVLNNINKLMKITSNEDVKILLSLDQKDQKYFTNNDLLTGSVSIQNNTKYPINFDMFYVTFEGEFKLETDTFDAEYQHQEVITFLRMVDLGASWTDVDSDSAHPTKGSRIGLPKNRILSPKMKYEKNFSFKIPSTALNQTCSADLEPHSLLPPSFGSETLRLDNTHLHDKMYKKFSYKDLAGTSSSVNYSINARLVVLSKVEPPRYMLKTDSKTSVLFIPTASKQDSYLDYDRPDGWNNYQLKQLADRIESNIREAQTTIDAIDQDRRILVYDRHRIPDNPGGDDTGEGTSGDPEIRDEAVESSSSANTNASKWKMDDSKKRNLYNDSNVFHNPSRPVEVHGEHEAFSVRHRKDYNFFRRRKKKRQGLLKLVSSKSSPPSSSATLTDTSSSTWSGLHDAGDVNSSDFDSGILSISSDLNEKLMIDFNALTNPFDNVNKKDVSIPLTLDFKYIMPASLQSSNYASCLNDFIVEPDIDLIYVNVNSKGLPIPVELQHSWFASRKIFRETVSSTFRNLSRSISKLPKGARLYNSVVSDLRTMIKLDYTSDAIQKAFTIEASSKSSVENQDANSVHQKMHLSLKFDQAKAKNTLLVPSFESCYNSRLYFLRLKFKTHSSSSLQSELEFEHDAHTKDVLQQLDGNYKFYLDVPISIKKMD